MAYLLGLVLGTALAAALQAFAIAYLWALLGASIVVAALPTFIGAAVLRRTPTSHWFFRPAAMGVVFGLALAGALAASFHGLEDRGQLDLLRPLVPGFIALPFDVLLIVLLAVRGLRSGLRATGGTDLRTRSRAAALLAGRAASRAAAVLTCGAGTLVVVATAFIAVTEKNPNRSISGHLLVGAVGAFTVGGLGSLFAWWGRPKTMA